MRIVATGGVWGRREDTVVVDGDRIAALTLGDGEGEEASTHRVAGVVVPAFRDGHLHPVALAAAGARLDVSGARSFTDLSALLRSRAGHLPPNVPLIATGLDDERLTEGEMPTRHELDGAIVDRPVLVYRHCSHVAVANTTALTMAGLDGSMPDPPGGRMGRTALGSLTGLLEETAIGLVSAPLASGVTAPDADTVLATLRDLRRRGLVAVDAMVSAGPSMWCAGGNELEILRSISPDLPVVVDVYVIADTADELRAAAVWLAETGGRLRFAGWKGFADGSLGARTAALREPYADAPHTSGLDRGLSPAMGELGSTALELGGVAAIHAIGDLAVERALAVAEALGEGTVRIEHASVADPDQVGRMAAAGIVASIQPSFVRSDREWIGRRLGPRRVAWSYPFRTMEQAGVELRGGSDAPIEDADPLVGIRDATADRPEGLDPVRAVAAYAASPLEPGAPASFVVLDGDPFGSRLPRVLEVWMDGRRVE